MPEDLAAFELYVEDMQADATLETGQAASSHTAIQRY